MSVVRLQVSVSATSPYAKVFKLFKCGNVFILSKIKRLPIFPDVTPPKRNEARRLSHDKKLPRRTIHRVRLFPMFVNIMKLRVHRTLESQFI